MDGPLERTLVRGVVFKNLVIGIGSIAVAVIAMMQFIAGNWVVGLLLLTVGELVWYIAADIATGIILAPFIGVAALRGRRHD